MRRSAILLLLAMSLCTMASEPVSIGPSPGLAPVIARITRSVALVETVHVGKPGDLNLDPMLQRFFNVKNPEPKERSEAGTAFVVDAAAGLLVTTDYVVRGAERVEVTLATGEKRAATVAGFDEATGVGLLRVAPEGLEALEWSAAEPAIGDPAVLVAYVFKKGPIATVGIVSGRDLLVNAFNAPSLFLDVAVNKGAAGGAVTTADGRVIAMAYGMFGTGGDPYASLGVAVPATEMRPVIEALAREGKVRRGWIGVTVGPDDLHQGARILAVEEDGPAARAGLEPLDIVTAVAGERIRDDLPLRRAVARAVPGTMLTLTVRGRDDKVREVVVTTGTRPD